MWWHVLAMNLSASTLPWIILLLVATGFVLWLFTWALAPQSTSSPIGESLDELSGMNAELSGQLARFGLRTDRDLMRLTSRGQQDLESQLNLDHGQYDHWRAEISHRWRNQFLPEPFRQVQAIVPDPELGGIYSKPPLETDDFTKLPGVDEAKAHRIHDAGIYTFEQLRFLAPQQRACFRQRFHLPDFNFDAVPEFGVTAQWLEFQSEHSSEASLAYSKGDDKSAVASNVARQPSVPADAPEQSAVETCSVVPATVTIPRSLFDPDLGRIYTCPPPHRDDLTRLTGVTGELATQLNTAGIYTIAQLRSWTPKQQDAFRERFAVPDFDFSQWSAAEQPRRERRAVGSVPPPAPSASPDPANSATNESEPLVTPPYPATPAAAPPAACMAIPAALLPADDLTRLPQVDDDIARRMNAAGIVHFQQLQELSLPAQIQLRTEFGFSHAQFVQWLRLIHAWSHGVSTTIDAASLQPQRTGWLHQVRLPLVAPNVFDGQQLVAYPEQVVFRGKSPEHWGEAIEQPIDGIDKTLAFADVRTDINYVRVRRLDTRASVVTTVTKASLFTPCDEASGGWNGLCEYYRGARHLGIFATHVPREVEPCWGRGGWGFGDQALGTRAGQTQGFSWAGRMLPPTLFEISVGRIGPTQGTVVFHSSDPSIWNQTVQVSDDSWAKSLCRVKHAICYVRIRRLDTAAAVVVPVDHASVVGRSDHPDTGWNGLADDYFGARHLGVYRAAATGEVHVAYGRGGWGFGHDCGCATAVGSQGYAWAGERIGETAFEITVYDQLPPHLRRELLVS